MSCEGDKFEELATVIFKQVWYCASPPRAKFPVVYDDYGALILRDGEALFKSRNHAVFLDLNEECAFGRYGTDFVNRWIKTRSTENKEIYLCDGRFLGWVGVFGGTLKIFNQLQNLRARLNERNF